MNLSAISFSGLQRQDSDGVPPRYHDAYTVYVYLVSCVFRNFPWQPFGHTKLADLRIVDSFDQTSRWRRNLLVDVCLCKLS